MLLHFSKSSVYLLKELFQTRMRLFRECCSSSDVSGTDIDIRGRLEAPPVPVESWRPDEDDTCASACRPDPECCHR